MKCDQLCIFWATDFSSEAEDAATVAAKLAQQRSTEIEIVAHSDVLMALGGVGCLLRYPPPDDIYR